MLYALVFTLFFLLILVVWEDVGYRAVHWYLFPLIFICLIGIDFKENIIGLCWHEIFSIMIFLLAQVLFAGLYFSLKEKRRVNIFRSYFGLGDLLLLLSISPGFSLINFVMFYICSLFVILLLFGIRGLIKKDWAYYQIPLAGIQSAIYLLILAVNMLDPFLNLHDDRQILSYLSMISR